MTGVIVGGPYHPPLCCHSTEAKQAVMTSQFMAIVLCMHGQRAVEKRPRIAATSGVSETVSHWRTRTARNHMPPGPGCQRGLVFYGQVKGEKTMTKVIRGIVGGPYHQPLWRCHSTEAKQAKSNRGAPYIYWGYSRCCKGQREFGWSPKATSPAKGRESLDEALKQHRPQRAERVWMKP